METLKTLLIIMLLVGFIALSISSLFLIRKHFHLREMFQQLLHSHADCLDKNYALQYYMAVYVSTRTGIPLPTYNDGEPWHPQDMVTFNPILGENIYKGIILINTTPDGHLKDDYPLILSVDGNPEMTFLPEQVTDVNLTFRPQCRKILEDTMQENTPA